MAVWCCETVRDLALPTMQLVPLSQALKCDAVQHPFLETMLGGERGAWSGSIRVVEQFSSIRRAPSLMKLNV